MPVFTHGEGEEPKKEEDNPFTHYYGQLLHQGNMLQDLVRTGTYQQSFLQNRSNFEDKVVLDVGTGTGILAFFAAQAGARKVMYTA
jgi:histone-arginine methyltransferase CARM1